MVKKYPPKGSKSARRVSAARTDIADYWNWYKTGRPHSHLDRMMPEQTYLYQLPQLAKAA